MALNIYKPGQGYWTRVLSVCGAAALLLAGAAFIWTQMETLGHAGGPVARKRTELTGRVVAWGKAQSPNPLAGLNGGIEQVRPVPSSTNRTASPARVDAFEIVDEAGKTYPLTNEQLRAAVNYDGPGYPPMSEDERKAFQIAHGLPTSVTFQGDTVSIQVKPDFAYRNRTYIQFGVAAAILLTAGGLLAWVFNKPSVVDFMIATEAEMKKVNWPTRREVVGSTWVVICGSLMMAVLLFGIDVVFAWLFRTIHILQ
jgi:preprotein translocase subunit SecE